MTWRSFLSRLNDLSRSSSPTSTGLFGTHKQQKWQNEKNKMSTTTNWPHRQWWWQYSSKTTHRTKSQQINTRVSVSYSTLYWHSDWRLKRLSSDKSNGNVMAQSFRIIFTHASAVNSQRTIQLVDEVNNACDNIDQSQQWNWSSVASRHTAATVHDKTANKIINAHMQIANHVHHELKWKRNIKHRSSKRKLIVDSKTMYVCLLRRCVD